MHSPDFSEEAPWKAGVRSARANLWPGFVLQIAALSLVIAYYRHAPTQAWLDRLADWRLETGVFSAVVTTGLFGGLLPQLYLRLRRETRHAYTLSQSAAIALFWTYKGLEVDCFYRGLAWLVGDGHDLRTIAIKTAIDQILYCPLFAVPSTVLLYEWTMKHFDRASLVADIRRGGWMRRRVLPVLISNLSVWLPAVCIIYAMPTPLQLPLQNLVLCFFTLLVAHQTRRVD